MTDAKMIVMAGADAGIFKWANKESGVLFIRQHGKDKITTVDALAKIVRKSSHFREKLIRDLLRRRACPAGFELDSLIMFLDDEET